MPDPDIFTERGIEPGGRVWRARGYRAYPAGRDAYDVWDDVDPRLLRMPRGWRNALIDKKAEGGWAIPRYAVMPDADEDLEHWTALVWNGRGVEDVEIPWSVDPVAQLRPTNPVRMRAPYAPDHWGRFEHVDGGCPCGSKHGPKRKRVWSRVVYQGERRAPGEPWTDPPLLGDALKRHIAKDVHDGGHTD